MPVDVNVDADCEWRMRMRIRMANVNANLNADVCNAGYTMRLVDETFHALRRKLCPFVLQPKRHLCEGAHEGCMCEWVCAESVCLSVYECVLGSVCLPSRCCLPWLPWLELASKWSKSSSCTRQRSCLALAGGCCVNFCTPSIRRSSLWQPRGSGGGRGAWQQKDKPRLAEAQDAEQTCRGCGRCKCILLLIVSCKGATE